MPELTLEIAIIAVLLAVNAFLAASEIALVSAHKARLRGLAEAGHTEAQRVLTLTEDPSDFLATVQVGITLAGFFASAVGAISLVTLLASWLEQVPTGTVRENAEALALVIVTALLSFVSIVFGELVPKTVAIHRADSLALVVARPIQILATLTAPLVTLLTTTSNLTLRLLGVQARAQLPSVTADELLSMVEVAEDEGVVEEQEAELIEEAFQFGKTIARDVMVPRVDTVAIASSTPLGQAVDVFFASGFSRLPVYEESLDHILGILYLKDVFRLLWRNDAEKTHAASTVMRPAYFVPETKPVDELLTELRTRRIHIAIVVDEFGGMAGLVTLEDLVEELVGEIVDEFDADYEPFQMIAPGVLDVDGRVSVRDLLDRLNLERTVLGLMETESVSVGGLIADRLGRIPHPGDVVAYGPLQLEVRTMDGHRVRVVRVEYHEPAIHH